MNDPTRDLLVRGVAALKARDYAEARHYFDWLLRLDPPLEQRLTALLGLAQMAPTPAEKRKWVEEALAYDPGDMRARRELALLNGQLNPAEVVDPDQIAAPAQGEAPSGARRFVCPRCGGRMTFAPDGQTLTCEYCETRQAAETHRAALDGTAAESFLIAMATRRGHLHPTKRQTFSCPACGIDFLLPPQQMTLTCPYCGAAYALQPPHPRELIDPHWIVPFRLDEATARRALRGWLEAAPRAAGLQVEPPAALYLPLWSFEMSGQVPWRCEMEEADNRWIPEAGREIVYHYSVPVPASRQLSAECAAELRGFDLRRDAQPFDERCLASWPAETYTLPLGGASLQARAWTFEFEKEQVRGRFLHRTRSLTFSSAEIAVESFRLALLPLWLAHLRLGEQRIEVVINGQTGAVRASAYRTG